MKNAIVSGADGFIGSWLVRELKKNNIGVTGLAGPGYKLSEEEPGSDSLLKVSMTDYYRLSDMISPKEDCVFYHLAWDGVYGPKRKDSALQLNNAVCAEKAVSAAKALGCTRFINLGSIMEKEITAIFETGGIKPSSSYIYGEAKHCAHMLTMAKAAELGIDYICPILTNPYGEYDNSARFINMVLNKIISGRGLEFTSGLQMYDFIYIEDAVKALVLLGEKGKPFDSYLIGSGKPMPLKEYVKVICTVLDYEGEVSFGAIPYTGAEMCEADFDTKSLENDTGFKAAVSFEEGILRTYSLLKKQKSEAGRP